MRQDLPGIIGTVGRVTVLRAAEGCKGVADAASPAATCAVASVWQKLAIVSKMTLPSKNASMYAWVL
jgi:hypothetical protein